jgi:hypothetical protein
MKIGLEDQLQTSFPDPINIEKIRRMLIEDTKNDTLGLESYFEGNEIYFIYPIVDMKQGLKYYLEHGIN